MPQQRIQLTDRSAGSDGGHLIIHKFPFRIGRRPAAGELIFPGSGTARNDLNLDDNGPPYQVSRAHVEIGFADGRPYVRDLGSARGTRVDNQVLGANGHRQGASTMLAAASADIQVGDADSPWKFELRLSDHGPRHSMLIADDDPRILAMLRDLFWDDYTITEAHDGREALQGCFAEPPDIAVLDWEMPNLAGVDVCKELKANLHTSTMPVVMLTGRDAVKDEVTGIVAGADAYITKPVDMARLQAEVNGIVSRHERARNICCLTGLTSDLAFADEVAHVLNVPEERDRFALIAVQVRGAGKQARRQGVDAATIVRETAAALWEATAPFHETVLGQLRLDQWAVLTPASRRGDVMAAIKEELRLTRESEHELSWTVKHYAAARFQTVYDFFAKL
jgi:DNA-binding response OmpR family regulator